MGEGEMYAKALASAKYHGGHVTKVYDTRSWLGLFKDGKLIYRMVDTRDARSDAKRHGYQTREVQHSEWVYVAVDRDGYGLGRYGWDTENLRAWI
jgi:hypothetical protein